VELAFVLTFQDRQAAKPCSEDKLRVLKNDWDAAHRKMFGERFVVETGAAVNIFI